MNTPHPVPMLSLRGVGKSFDGHPVLAGVDLAGVEAKRPRIFHYRSTPAARRAAPAARNDCTIGVWRASSSRKQSCP